MTVERFDATRFERDCFNRIAYICRYAHVPMVEVLSLTRRDADLLQRALSGIVQEENGK